MSRLQENHFFKAEQRRLARRGQIENTPQDAQKDCPARPQRVKARGVPLRYVEGLNDARTPLAGFFSILLERRRRG
jgi:hypothetical protein